MANIMERFNLAGRTALVTGSAQESAKPTAKHWERLGRKLQS